MYQVTDKQNRHRDMKEYTTFKTIGELGPRGRASGQEENGDEEPKCGPMPVATRSVIENNHQVSRGNILTLPFICVLKKDGSSVNALYLIHLEKQKSQ